VNYDGNVVFAHTDYNVFGPKVGFDIFRFEDGKIVEHWDNLQDTAARPGPSGHTIGRRPDDGVRPRQDRGQQDAGANLHG
jgi:hypothetical protein